MSEMDEGGGNGEGNDPSDTLGDSDEEQWEYYDDNTTLTDFWQVCFLLQIIGRISDDSIKTPCFFYIYYVLGISSF